nr:preprotein translocase subunit Sec61beta [Nanoarchaeota archaeon]
MGKQDKIQMPSSGAGITRYFDDYKSKIEFKPEHVVILVIVVIIIILILHLQGGAWF